MDLLGDITYVFVSNLIVNNQIYANTCNNINLTKISEYLVNLTLVQWKLKLKKFIINYTLY